MELIGQIYKINETQNVTDTFSKREFIIKTDTQYPQYILLQVVKDKCAVLDGYKIGDNIKASINIDGRLWTNPSGEEKCFNTLNCWRIEKETVQQPTPIPATPAFTPTTNLNEDEPDDMPF